MRHVRDLLESGLSQRDIQRLRSQGERLTWGTYVGKGLEEQAKYRLKCRAVLARLKPGAALAGPSAAAFWEIPMQGAPPSRVYVRNIVRGTYGSDVHVLGEGPVVRDGGLLITAPHETVADCARLLASQEALVIADGILAAELCTPRQMKQWADTYAGRPQASRVRWVAMNADPASESPGETCTRHLAVQLGYDLESQYHVVVGDRHAWLDFLVKGTRIAVEFDGLIKYRKKAHVKVAQEKLRQGDLEAVGYRFVRFIHPQLSKVKQFDQRLKAAGAVPSRAVNMLTW